MMALIPIGKIIKFIGKIIRIAEATEDILKEKEKEQRVKELRKKLKK